ncbi:unnamed protein product [Moneuplotes crassus]|uniref:Uncharacterized protein n=1 Tax=Euplotes crassus TaxID=5936 RepID=A0AAD1XVY0_EUPCR|nr:unnamed protein product [Moneuplotes crassus]
MGNNCCVSKNEGTQLETSKMEPSPKRERLNMKAGATQGAINEASNNSSDCEKSESRRNKSKKASKNLSDCREEVKETLLEIEEVGSPEKALDTLKDEITPTGEDLVQTTEDDVTPQEFKTIEAPEQEEADK